MTPALFRRQLDAGAWGITLASATQTRAAYAHGVHRVLMANQLVGTPNMALIADLLADPTFDFYCMVDHPDNVADLGAYFASRGVRLNVMIEYGVVGGRCGCRTRRGSARAGQGHCRATGAGADRDRRLRRGDSRRSRGERHP